MLRFGGGWHGQHDPVEFAQFLAPFARTKRTVGTRPAHGNDRHVEGFEACLDQRTDGAHAEQKHTLARQFPLARTVTQPFMTILRPHHIAISLGMG